jgi:hypothetical protein
MCEVNGSKVIKGGGYKKSNIHVVGDKSYMDATIMEIIFLIFEGRSNQ